MSTPADRLRERVQAAAADTPYRVTPTAAGFDVTADIADQRWLAVVGQGGVQRSVVHHVSVADDGTTYTITDDYREVRWHAGAASLAGSSERIRGRVVAVGRQRVWATGPDGAVVRLGDLRFDSEEGRELVAAAAAGLGLRSRRGGAERLGLVVGLVAAVGSLVAVVVLVVAWLLGAFG